MVVQSLTGTWEVRRVGEKGWFPATVPGVVHLDLLAAGRIPDPFVADNELQVQWVAEADWEYRRRFTVEPSLLAHDRVLLECEGLDTLATVLVNGEEVGRGENMYLRCRFEVKEVLQEGHNRLLVRFASPVKYARRRLRRDPLLNPAHSIPGAPYVRKSPCQWGWDWGPKLPPTGIWRDIRLAGYTTARLENVHLRQEHHRNGTVTIRAKVTVDRWKAVPLRARLRVTAPDGEVLTDEVRIRSDRQVGHLMVNVARPRLWWPNGYGEQPLYRAEVELYEGEELRDREEKRLGLRTLRLQRKKDYYGESFTFLVNGVPIFCKGANWIPADSFPPRVTSEHYRHLLGSAAAAHMNMLRVWGGGYYEDERFYDLCDELGILIWQDFMFSCSVYPGDEEFVENVRREVVDNIRRIRHHPCLALWCGNNELEWGWVEWGWSQGMTEKHRQDYDRMFHHLLPEIVAAEDPDTPYWPSSPSSNLPFQNPNAEERGDGHYWEVWHGRVPFTEYRKHYFRFQSEFGFQSLPPLETVAAFAEEKDWNMTSYILEHHQRHPAGNGLIIYYLTQNFRLPKDFPALCYLSQVLQAEAIRYGVEHWRRNRHRVSGTLYWQLNDCWPVVSWSSIDYFGRWKALHYAAKRFFAPVLLSAEEKDVRVDLHLTNDRLEPFRGEVRWSLETLEGEVFTQDALKVEVPPECNRRVVELHLGRPKPAEDGRGMVLVYELWAGRKRLSLGLVTFVPNKHLELPDPGLRVSVREREDHLAVTVAAQRLARFVWLHAPGLDLPWSDNYFDLPAGRQRTVTVPKVEGWTASRLKQALRVRSLVDSY